jgi:RNAse (barnase) inhibitor barstar
MARPKKVVLRERDLVSPDQAHEILAESLGFPDYYGMNLDALADCLSEVTDPARIVLRRSASSPKPWFDGFERVVRDVAEQSCYVGCTVRYDS